MTTIRATSFYYHDDEYIDILIHTPLILYMILSMIPSPRNARSRSGCLHYFFTDSQYIAFLNKIEN